MNRFAEHVLPFFRKGRFWIRCRNLAIQQFSIGNMVLQCQVRMSDCKRNVCCAVRIYMILWLKCKQVTFSPITPSGWLLDALHDSFMSKIFVNSKLQTKGETILQTYLNGWCTLYISNPLQSSKTKKGFKKLLAKFQSKRHEAWKSRWNMSGKVFFSDKRLWKAVV